MMSYGDLLRICREQAGFTQAELANRVHVSQALVAKYEAEVIVPNIEKYSDMLDACGYEFGVRQKKTLYTMEEMKRFLEEHR